MCHIVFDSNLLDIPLVVIKISGSTWLRTVLPFFFFPQNWKKGDCYETDWILENPIYKPVITKLELPISYNKGWLRVRVVK